MLFYEDFERAMTDILAHGSVISPEPTIGLLVLQSSEPYKPPFFILPTCLTIYHYEKQTKAKHISSSTLDK